MSISRTSADGSPNRAIWPIAPELYARQGDVSKLADISQIMPIVAKVPDEQVMTDLDAAVIWAENSGQGDITKLGITGFCWGGRIVWLYAAHNPALKAGVAWYGRLVGQPDPLHPQNPVDAAGSLKAPVLGLYGGQDQGITAESREMMRAALKSGRQPVANRRLPGCRAWFPCRLSAFLQCQRRR